MVSNRLLKIIFVILLVVIFGELMYYVYIHFEIIKRGIYDNNIVRASPTHINIPTLINDSPTFQPFRSSSKEISTYLSNCRSIPTCKGGWYVINIEGKVREIRKDNNIAGGIKLRLYKDDSFSPRNDDVVYINLNKTKIKDKEGNVIIGDHIQQGNVISIEIKYNYVANDYLYNLVILK